MQYSYDDEKMIWKQNDIYIILDSDKIWNSSSGYKWLTRSLERRCIEASGNITKMDDIDFVRSLRNDKSEKN